LEALVRKLGLAIPALVAIAVAGCGSDNNDNSSSKNNTPAAPSKPAAASAVNVKETEFKLTPSTPKAKKGTVTFNVTNAGNVTHSLEVEGPGGEKRLPKELQPGQSGTIKVDLSKDGKYEWYCPVDNHKQMGMKGEITVGSGGGGKSSKDDSSSGGGSGY
jgi:uncharacterized cupredoxin-like copper-binding protein